MSGSQSQDRHLLFGLLACQNEFITHAQLLSAFSAWIVDKSKSLDEILVVQGALSSQDRNLFDRLVEKHLAKFNGDAAESLANLGGISSIRDELATIASGDAIALQSVTQLPAPRVQDSAFATIVQPAGHASTPISFSPSTSTRFRIVRQHARGGLGVVFVAEDQDLHREVAMKQIRDDRADHAGYQIKFMQEAEITGQLEHPGIVPIYALGTDAKGRPYYAMRFIRGEDLQSRIRTFHANRKASHSQFEGSELRGLLRRFVDVCNAIQYAHERGVLHRDLKPGNVMLGKHGETLVVDWGLAKPFGKSNSSQVDLTATIHEHSESQVERSGTASGSETRDGTFIGTPAYAPPEQVLGQLDKLGPRSDVYSLGGILYELLTGNVPVRGTTVKEVITKATTGDFPAPRTLDANIPKALEAICRKAMAVKLDDRYASAEQLRAEVENWLDDSPVSAYQEPLLARAHRLIRKNPVTASWTAAAVLMALLGAAGYAMVSAGHNRELVKKNQIIAEEKIAAEQARDAEAIAKDSAVQARDAEEVAKNAALFSRSQAVGVRDFLVDIFRQPDPSRDGRKVTVYDSMVAGLSRVRRDFANDPETAISLLTSIYESYTGLGLYNEANELILEVMELRKANHLDQDEGAIRNRNDLGKNQKLLGKYAESIKTHDDLYRECVQKRGQRDLLTLQVKHDLANAYRAAGQLQAALAANQEVLQARSAVLGERDPDYLSSQNTLANSLQAVGDFKEALVQREVNYEARKKVLGATHPDTLSSESNLGISLLEAGQVEESLRVQTSAFEARKELLGLEHPDALASLFNLANVMVELGKNDEAEAMFVDAIAGLKASLGDSHPSTLAAMAGLGRILERQGHFDRAIKALEQVHLTQETSLGADHPNTLASLNSLASAYERIGEVDQAQALLEKGIERAHAVLGPNHEITVDLQLTLEVVYFSQDEIEKGLALCEKLSPITAAAFGDAHPKTLKARNNLALAYFVVGDLTKAFSIYQELEVTQTKSLGPDHPETLRTELGSLYTLRDMGRFDEALTQAERTLAKARKSLGSNDALTLDVVDTLGYFYMVANRMTDAKDMFYEELQSRVKKFGINNSSTVLAGSYLVTAAEQLKDWGLVKTVCKKFADELPLSEQMSAASQDFSFRLGYALDKLGESQQPAEQLMTASLTAVQVNATPPAPPQLSSDEMEVRLHEFYTAHGKPDEAQRYLSEINKAKTVD